MTPHKTKCTAVTAQGAPCKAWAIHGSNPPRCAPHAGITGAPAGNSNAVTHGFYSRQAAPKDMDALLDSAARATLVEEAALLRVVLRRLAGFLEDSELPASDVRSIVPLIISATRALAYVEKHLPDPNAIDWDAALDELGKEPDWDI